MRTIFFKLYILTGLILGWAGLRDAAQAQQMDFGDAPEAGTSYPTTLARDGARHTFSSIIRLGANLDTEPDGQPDSTATGDDMSAVTPDDEDGVTFTSALVPGQVATLTVNNGGTVPGVINAWVDFNRNGSWADTGEQIFINRSVLPGNNILNFNVPAAAAVGNTFARFRIMRTAIAGFTFSGPAPDGEVEDYQVTIGFPQGFTQDFGDAPDPTYPTKLPNGARHTIVANFCLGTEIDGEADGQPDPAALGDDNLSAGSVDDEDGVTFTSPLIAGQSASVLVTTTMNAAESGRLDAWIDFNRNGNWADPGDQIFTSILVVNGPNSLTFNVPASAVPGSTFARFRLSRQGMLSFSGPLTGAAPDGEVEDYQVTLEAPQDFSDAPAPYPTLLADNGARHTLLQGFYLGARVDAESDGQPNATATGDDINPPTADDEDGVVFTTPLVQGRPASVAVTASQSGFLNAWVDFNGDGDWADSGEQIATALALAPGVNNVPFTVPAGAKTGRTFCRFRFSHQASLSFVGAAVDGEVEDHPANIITDRERCDLSCAGRDFWLTFPGNYAPDPDNPVKPALCIVGAPGVMGTVSIAGLAFSMNFTIPASFSINVALPSAADLGDLNGGITNKGIHVTANGDVQIYAISKVNYTSDSYLALPASILGKEYIVLGYGNVHTNAPPLNGSQFAIVACESDTAVTITPSFTTGGHAIGVPFNIVLQSGDTYQLRATNDRPAELSGTIVTASKPIALLGSHQCANIPSSNVWFCDYIVEQLLPVNEWGTTFYTAPLKNRAGGDTFRVLSGSDANTVYLNGAAIGLLNRGQFLQLLLTAGARISADKPVLVAQYANSADYDPPAGSFSQGDPFMCLVQATRHYETSYTVCSFINGFGANFLNIIAPTGSKGTVQLNGLLVGAGAFVDIPASGYSYAQVTVTAARNTVTGGAPFALYAYGWSEYESYGHPACFFVGDAMPPTVSTAAPGGTASVNDHPNTPGFVPAPDVATGAQVMDNCDPQPSTPTQTPIPGTLLPPGVHNITVAAQDSLGNIGLANFTFTVLDPSPVIITCPSDIVVNCASTDGAVVNFQVAAATTYDPNVPVVSMPPSGSLFPVGTTVVHSTATSLAGQANSCSFRVTVVCQGRITVSTGPNGLTLTWTGTPGTLERASAITGPWLTVATGVNTFKVRPTGTSEFFRVRY